ncbi:hypothetical protein OAM29_00530 [Flavobacteriaceae bacterium]|nr:hypothetical protein [Flavobacteriaceae bacterium]
MDYSKLHNKQQPTTPLLSFTTDFKYIRDMKKLILILKFIRTGLTIRNLLISTLGGIAMLFLIFVIGFFIGDLDYFEWNNDLIFPIIMGAAVSLSLLEKPTISWEEYWKKNK